MILVFSTEISDGRIEIKSLHVLCLAIPDMKFNHFETPGEILDPKFVEWAEFWFRGAKMRNESNELKIRLKCTIYRLNGKLLKRGRLLTYAPSKLLTDKNLPRYFLVGVD